MPLNGFSIGRDVTINVRTAAGQLNFKLLNSFKANPDVADEKRVAIDGVSRHAIFHEGWRGHLAFDRADNNFDAYWAQVEADYYNGLNNGSGTIMETITEVDGSVSQYQYIGVILKPTDMGEWSGNKVVTQGAEFMATRRVRIS